MASRRMIDPLMLVPMPHAQIVDVVGLVALDAAFVLQLVEPAVHMARCIEILREKHLRQIVRLGVAAPLVIDDGPEQDEQQPRVAADPLHAGGAGEGRLDGADTGHKDVYCVLRTYCQAFSALSWERATPVALGFLSATSANSHLPLVARSLDSLQIEPDMDVA